jgi:hypothetical protein
VQEAFEKLKGIDIFALKSYMEETSWGSFNGIWVMVNEIFVNFPFFVLNLLVGFFSLTIRLLENINFYDTYKQYVYDGAKDIWQGFTGSTTGGIAQTSLAFLLLLGLGFYLFFQFALSRGNFSRKILHVILVILLGLGWFGTVSGTSGGLYLLNTIDNISQAAISKISSISVSYGKNQSLTVGNSVADTYIAETSYKAYLFVNTGREDGKYIDRQTGKTETFDNSKVLGGLDESGQFKAVSTSDRYKYLNMGDGANDDKEKNRWVSAIADYIPIKFFYVLFKIVEAIVLAVPIILIQLLNVIAQALVLIMILLFPIALLISFIPRMQDILFGVFKIMFGGLAFPSITGLLTLVILYLEKMIEGVITGGFDKAIESFPSLTTFKLLFSLMISVVAKGVIYWLLWKYKGELLELLLGARARIMIDDIDYKVKESVEKGKDTITQIPQQTSNAFDLAQRSGSFFLAGAGLGAGVVVNSGKHIKGFFSNQPPTTDTSYPDEVSSNDVLTTDVLDNHEKQTTGFSPKGEHTDFESEIEAHIQSEDSNSQQKFSTQQTVFTEDITSPEQIEFEERRRNRLSWKEKRRINKLEKQLDNYKDDESMYKAQGSNVFIRNYRKTMTPDEKLRTNINHRNHIMEELDRLRGEH